MNFMFILYDLVFLIFLVFYLPVMLIKGKWHSNLLRRFGLFSPEQIQQIKSKKNIWIHAVSVGEVLAILDFIDKIRRDYPKHQLVFSTVTPTGYVLAQSRLKESDVVIFAPLDFSRVVRKYIRMIEPKVYIAAETEIWPNLFAMLQRLKIPIMVMNGRISDQSFSRYSRISFLLRNIFRGVNIFCMQSELDAERVISLGALSNHVKVVGNVKFDSAPRNQAVLPQNYGFHSEDQILVAGSTHPGEEEVILKIYKELRGQFKHLRLIIAPRHVERAQTVVKLIGEYSFSVARLSRGKNSAEDPSAVLLVDTVGQLRNLYALATVVFIGKTISSRGGQNMIEPAALGKPVVAGPYTENFKDVMSLFLKDNAIIQVDSVEKLKAEILKCLEYPPYGRGIGARARQLVEQSRGATEKTVQLLKEILPV